MIFHLLHFALLFLSWINPSIPENQVVVKKVLIDKEIEKEIQGKYNRLSNKERLRLLWLSNDAKDSTFFNTAAKKPSVVSNYMAYIQSNNKTELLANYLNDQAGGNAIPFNGIEADKIYQDDYISDSPLKRAIGCDSLIIENLSYGSVLVFNKSKVDTTNLTLPLLSREENARKTIEQMHYSAFAMMNLSELSQAEISSYLCKAKVWKGVFFLQNSSGEEIRNEDNVFNNYKLGVDLQEFNKEVFEKFVSKYSSDASLREMDVKEKCLKILRLQYLTARKTKTAQTIDFHQLIFHLNVASMTCIKNEDLLPIKSTLDKVKVYASPAEKEAVSTLENYADKVDENFDYELFISFDNDVTSMLDVTKTEGGDKKILVTSSAVLMRTNTETLKMFKAIIVAPDSSALSQRNSIQAVYGANDCTGVLPFEHTLSIENQTSTQYASLKRLKYANPIDLGLSQDSLIKIDKIVTNAIEQGAFPGCQVLFAWKGVVVYQKSFGFIDSKKEERVHNQVIYDLASISKIAGSTVGLMHLESLGKFSLDKQISDYMTEEKIAEELKSISLKDMMAHQAGLPAWIPFYKRMMLNGKPNKDYFQEEITADFQIPVAKNLFGINSVADSVYSRIYAQKLGAKSYVYSDLGYYFVKKIIESQTNEKFDDFLNKEIYKKLGLRTMGFNPLLKHSSDRIAPTENDKDFRMQTIRGYVHDPGAALLGGVGGHAGLFSNANDLAILMQMLLNDGFYGGKKILEKDIIEKYTSVQFPGKNRRGAGFDKPTFTKIGGTACPLVSSESYGHSGFTGTLTWADPTHQVNYVFLSNRVNPNADNWKITKMNIRTDIQSVIYNSIKSAHYIDYSNRL